MKSWFGCMVAWLVLAAGTAMGETTPAATSDQTALAAKITAAGHKLQGMDQYLGGRRIKFDFQGEPAWIVAPSGKVQPGKWIWVTKWPGAFADGTGQKDALARGYHYMYLDDTRYWMNDKGVARAKAFYDFVTGPLGFRPKANLIGMSWGGFYATRFASTHPDCVNRMYLDNPVLNFGAFDPSKWKPTRNAWKFPSGANWKDNAAMPVSRTQPLAKAKIPILFMYGDKDTVVPPADNALVFLERLKAAGGDAKVIVRPGCNHHPHGFVDRKDWGRVVDFFEGK